MSLKQSTTMALAVVQIFAIYLCVVYGSPVWNPEPLQTCPKIPAQKNVHLEQITGDWRLAYIFLGQANPGLEEDNSCVVVSLTPTNSSLMEISVFIDTLRAEYVDRSTIEMPAYFSTPGEWQVHAPLASNDYLHARVILASTHHMVITFCAQVSEELDEKQAPEEKEEAIDWKTLFEGSNRNKRSSNAYFDLNSEYHLWTAVLVKHNDISALKFVEYAAVLMKYGFDVTKGELVSFGKCPITRNAQNLL